MPTRARAAPGPRAPSEAATGKAGLSCGSCRKGTGRPVGAVTQGDPAGPRRRARPAPPAEPAGTERGRGVAGTQLSPRAAGCPLAGRGRDLDSALPEAQERSKTGSPAPGAWLLRPRPAASGRPEARGSAAPASPLVLTRCLLPALSSVHKKKFLFILLTPSSTPSPFPISLFLPFTYSRLLLTKHKLQVYIQFCNFYLPNVY